VATVARASLLVLLAVAAGARGAMAQQVPAPQAVTLRDAIARAREVTPGVVTARGSVRSAELAVRTAKWQFIPQLTVTPQATLALNSGQSRVDPVTGEIISGNTSNPSYGLAAQADLNLFDGFARNHNLRAARAREAAADANLVTAQFASTLNVTNAFFDALANQELLKVNQAAVGRAEEQLRVATARLQTGAGQRTDSLTALVTLSQARQQLLQAEANLATSEANLARLVGTRGRVAAADDSAFYAAATGLDTTAIRAEVAASAPALASAQASLDAARASLRQSRAGYWPTVRVSANTQYIANRANDFELQPRRGLTLGLSFSPWTSLQRETQIENAAIAIDNAEASLADQQRQVDAQLTQYFAALGNAQRAIDVARLTVQAATENLRVARVRYDLGVMGIVEFTQIQEQLTQAQVSEIQARFSYLRAKAQVEAVAGRTY
jgi:outer membrane protein